MCFAWASLRIWLTASASTFTHRPKIALADTQPLIRAAVVADLEPRALHRLDEMQVFAGPLTLHSTISPTRSPAALRPAQPCKRVARLDLVRTCECPRGRNDTVSPSRSRLDDGPTPIPCSASPSTRRRFEYTRTNRVKRTGIAPAATPAASMTTRPRRPIADLPRTPRLVPAAVRRAGPPRPALRPPRPARPRLRPRRRRRPNIRCSSTA